MAEELDYDTLIENKLKATSRAVADTNGLLDPSSLVDAYKDIMKMLEDNRDAEAEAMKTTKDFYNELFQKQDEKRKKDNEFLNRQTLLKNAAADAKASGDKKTANQLNAQAKKEAKDRNKEEAKAIKEAMSDAWKNGDWSSLGSSLKDGIGNIGDKLKESFTDKDGNFNLTTGLGSAINKMSETMSNILGQIKTQMSEIAGRQTAWDTRLNGASESFSEISSAVTKYVGVSPWIKQQTLYQNLDKAINEGIAYNVEERALLDTLSDSIATTFDAFDESIKDLVRIQQEDSTAYRLGMEASLTEFLNKTYETTEYLNSVSDTVTKNLYEASALLDAQDSIGFEYQIQKWLGSMYSVGMSSSAISNISDALGKALSGDVSATDSGAGKLLVMAAANAGIDYSEMLTEGLNDSQLNKLMGSMVEYLQDIADSNHVVQSQYATLYGLTTTDIQAMQNLKGYTVNLYEEGKDYNSGSAINELSDMMGSISSRYSLAGMLENVKSNALYSMAGSIVSNPALYSMLTVSELLDNFAGGIDIPAISIMANMIDLETSVSDLLKASTFAGSMFSMIPAIFSGLSQIGGAESMYNAFEKISDSQNSVRLGEASNLRLTPDQSESQSSSTYSGNNSEDDYLSSSDAMVEDTKQEEGAKVEEDENEKDITDLYDLTTQILELLQDVTTGTKVFATSASSNYGLINIVNNS